MTQLRTVLTAAHAIRPCLATLLDPETAQQVDLQLQTLLTQAESGQVVELQIIEALRSHPHTKAWLQRYLEGETLDQITRSIGSYSGLPGDSSLPPAVKYVCPHNDYTWYREDNSEIPLCPTHLVPLVTARS